MDPSWTHHRPIIDPSLTHHRPPQTIKHGSVDGPAAAAVAGGCGSSAQPNHHRSVQESGEMPTRHVTCIRGGGQRRHPHRPSKPALSAGCVVRRHGFVRAIANQGSEVYYSRAQGGFYKLFKKKTLGKGLSEVGCHFFCAKCGVR